MRFAAGEAAPPLVTQAGLLSKAADRLQLPKG